MYLIYLRTYILDTYQEDMSIEEIDKIIKEEVKDFQEGYENFN